MYAYVSIVQFMYLVKKFVFKAYITPTLRVSSLSNDFTNFAHYFYYYEVACKKRGRVWVEMRMGIRKGVLRVRLFSPTTCNKE